MGQEAHDKAATEKMFGHLNSFTDLMLIKCTASLGLADIIEANAQQGGITLSQLAKSLPFDRVNTTNLLRIMRYLVNLGIFTKAGESGEDVFLPTAESQLLCKDREGLLPLLNLMTEEWTMGSWLCLHKAVDADNRATPFEVRNGYNMWEAATKQPNFNKMFNGLMANDTTWAVSSLVSACKDTFERIGSLVDVGGGIGRAAAHIAKAFPHIKCSVLDLPHVLATATDEFPNVELVPGDMFKSIPTANAIMMKRILHDWDDEESLAILKRCKEALPSEGGTLIIVDVIVDGSNELSKQQLVGDMGMMVFTGGKERTLNEWNLLLSSAGFEAYKVVPFKFGESVIEARPCPSYLKERPANP